MVDAHNPHHVETPAEGRTAATRSGEHGLGPHVIGQRVVVRRLLPGRTGPSGGPAMTDLLGVCTAWGDGRCVIRPESGEPVEIALSLIVSGKPVPPRPSVRHRTSAAEVERHGLGLWPSLVTEPLGEWVLRAGPPPEDGRPRKRANSALAFGDPGLPWEQAAARVTDFYSGRDQPVLAQVEVDGEVDAALTGLAWVEVAGGASVCLIGSVSRVLRTLRAAGRGAAGPPGPEPEYAEDGQRVQVSVADLARGQAAIDGDWLVVHGLLVSEAHRRSGLATRVMAALLDWGGAEGATTVWLHVEVDNAPARALYETLGLSEHHRNRYLTPGGQSG